MARESAQMFAQRLDAGAAAQAAAAEPTAVAAADNGAKKARRGEYGTAQERWDWRKSRDAVALALAKGCRCGCIEKFSRKYTIGDVAAKRQFHAEQSSDERRDEFMHYLDGNANDQGGYDLHLEHTSEVVCIVGYSYYHGHTTDWLYEKMRKHKVRAR